MRVRIRGLKMLVFWKSLRTYLIDGLLRCIQSGTIHLLKELKQLKHSSSTKSTVANKATINFQEICNIRLP